MGERTAVEHFHSRDAGQDMFPVQVLARLIGQIGRFIAMEQAREYMTGMPLPFIGGDVVVVYIPPKIKDRVSPLLLLKLRRQMGNRYPGMADIVKLPSFVKLRRIIDDKGMPCCGEQFLEPLDEG